MSLRPHVLAPVLAFVSLSLAAPALRGQCLSWSRDYAPDGINDTVMSMVVFDDGAGPALYAAGQFQRAGAVVTNNVAKWNGTGWLPLSNGNNGTYIGALAVFDDGSGAALYAGGSFTSLGGVIANNIARWNGSEWSPVGNNGVTGQVRALATFDDGTGPALYVGGIFFGAGGNSAQNIAKWDGNTWSALDIGIGSGPNNLVRTMAVFTNNGHTALYVGGTFTNAGTVSARCLARWNGTVWSDVDGGVEGLNPEVHSLSVFDDGAGPRLVVAGQFETAGTLAASNIATWGASTWSPLGFGLGTPGQQAVRATLVHDDGSGPKLHAVGTFTATGATPLARAAVWDGANWQLVGDGLSGMPNTLGSTFVNALCAYDDGSGEALYAAGRFGNSGALGMNSIASLRDGEWKPLGTHHGLKLDVTALGVFDDGNGAAVYAGGFFTTAGGETINRIARWDGASWQALGSGVSGGGTGGQAVVHALASFDDGNGALLYVTGSFTSAGGAPAGGFARWDGTAWSTTGTGFTHSPTAYYGKAFVVFDDGSGPALYVGGNFDSVDGVVASNIARWNGTSWSTLGAGTNGSVEALAVFDDGSGPALYAGGGFSVAGGVSTPNRLARWDGANWTALPSGGTNLPGALVVHDDGNGPALFVGGLNLGGDNSNNVSKWDGTSWTPSLGGGSNHNVRALASFDDGSGPALYAAGEFTDIGGSGASRIARWDGTSWSTLGSGIWGGGFGGTVFALCVADTGTNDGPSLFAGGRFDTADGKPALNIAEWRGCNSPGVSFCAGDGSVTACPCGNDGVEGHGCDNSQATGGALLESAGWTSLAFDSLQLEASSTLPNAASIFLQGSSEIAPVAFGDGLRCAGGSLIRLYVKAASGGVVSAPGPSDASVSERSAIQGDVLSVPDTRIYQVYYRDADPVFCATPFGNAWNVTNALRVQWTP